MTWSKKQFNCGYNLAIMCKEIPNNNINIIPGQLGNQMERTFSRNCNSLHDVLSGSVFSYSVINL